MEDTPLRAGNLKRGYFDTLDIVYISKEIYSKINTARISTGDILITRTGAKAGDSATVPPELNGWTVSSHTLIIKPGSAVNPTYISVFLNSRFGYLQIERMINGLKRQVNAQSLKDINFILPPKNIQDKIVNIMQDAYLERKQKLKKVSDIENEIGDSILKILGIEIQLKNETKRFIVSFQELSGSRFDVSYHSKYAKIIVEAIKKSSYPAENLGKYITEIRYGASVKNIYEEKGIPFIRIGNLRPNRIDISEKVYLPESMRKEIGKAFVQTGDLLMSRSGTVGIVASVTDETSGFAFGSYQIKFKVDDKLLPSYVSGFLNTAAGRIQSSREKTGAVQGNITIDGIKSIIIPIPPKDIQKRIENYINNNLEHAKQIRQEAEQIIHNAETKIEKIILNEN